MVYQKHPKFKLLRKNYFFKKKQDSNCNDDFALVFVSY